MWPTKGLCASLPTVLALIGHEPAILCPRNGKAEASVSSKTPRWRRIGETDVLGTILIVVLVLALIGALPRWGYSSGWGYYPSGGLGLILLIVLVLLLLRVI